jgi:predicted NAD/FAD-binding protein
VRGGSREYVARIMRDGDFETRLRTSVKRIVRDGSGVTIHAEHGGEQTFDDVVIATHGDQALRLLADPSPEERQILGAFRYSRNRAILHRDETLMPKRRRLWASWNYMSALPPAVVQTSTVTYWMNALQPLATTSPVFVSLNPMQEPRASKVLAEFDYTHPIFDPLAMAAQKSLWTLQGQRHTWFCGAHFGAGFHEDGLQSGLAVAEHIGAMRRPWTVENESGRIHVEPVAPETVRFPEAAE